MKKRKFVGMDGVPEELRYIPVSEWGDLDMVEDMTDEEIDAVFGQKCPENIACSGKMSIPHPFVMEEKRE